MRTPLLIAAVSLAACGNVPSETPDATVEEVVDAAPVEVCTPSRPGSAPADEDGDGAIDEGCAWSIGAAHWLSPLAGTQGGTSKVDPAWVSPDGKRLYLIVRDTDETVTARVMVASRTGTGTPFAAAVEVTGADLGNYSVIGIGLSQDETEAFFTASPAGKGTPLGVYRATRADRVARFGALAPVANLTTSEREEHPFVRADGKELLISSGHRLKRSVRASTDQPFGEATEIAGLPPGKLDGAQLSSDGRTLFFYGQVTGTPRVRIYRAERADIATAVFGPAVELAELDPRGEFALLHPVLSESTRELFFGSSRPWSPTAHAIWRAQLCRDGACTDALVDCPTGFRSDDGFHCYTELKTPQPHADAEKACRAQGGHLVSVHSDAERTLVYGKFGINHWLGGFDDRPAAGVAECNSKANPELPVTCAWGWESGERWTYSLWQYTVAAKQEPNESGTGEDCLAQWDENNMGRWNDGVCTVSQPGICETVRYPTW